MPANHSSVCGPPAQRGFSLLEVLVALLLTALGVFGAIGLQLNALRFSADSAHRAQALLMTNDLLERMRANRGALPLYAMTVSGECPEQAVENLPVLQQDRADFASAVTCQLPEGEARVTVDKGVARVLVRWSQARISEQGTARLQLDVRIGAQP
ncbi:type IV pilus modification protein PilV [Pseudomonas abyssi]|uniref:type IV pilus modification protein PilV n=1 Tax=Pseudomonas abyssi TaxID=170540 RepID=UPI003C79E3C8